MDPLASRSEAPDAAETRVRALLGDWAGRATGNPVPDFGRDISIASIRDKTAYAVFLRCLFDVRSEPVDKTLPYRESEPPKTADKKDPWSLPSGLSKIFLEQEATVVAAEAVEPSSCNFCAGEGQTGACEKCRGSKTAPCEACSNRGRKSCPACGGRGSIKCAQCSGSGKVLLSLTPDGLRTEDVCPQCTGKKELPCHDCVDAAVPDCAVCANKRVVACPKCEGRGTPLCSQCGGARFVVPGFTLHVDYKLGYYRSIVRDPSIPEAVFPEDPASGKLGDTVLECDCGDGETLADKKPEGPAGEAFAKVLAQASAAKLGVNSKAILQSLSVEKIPIYEVAYVYEGKEYHAWATSFQNRVVPLDDPFADVAARLTGEAESFLHENEFALFEDRLAKAATLAPKNPAPAALRGKAWDEQRRAVAAFGMRVSAGLSVALPAVLALMYKSPNRFIPLGALLLGVLAASAGAVFLAGRALASRPLMPAPRRKAWGAGAAAGGAVLATALFVSAAPIRRIDVREFGGKVSSYEAVPFVNWGPGDDAALRALIKEYGARGVDTTAGQNLLDGHASYLAAARAQALLDEQARRKAARLKAEAAKKEAARQKALAAKRLAAQKLAAQKAKKKKKKSSSRR
ncbi:MAG: hypothetical protein ACHQ2Z_06720 [Elusimicrobiota bacterium]